jgi:hypothetical protein
MEWRRRRKGGEEICVGVGGAAALLIPWPKRARAGLPRRCCSPAYGVASPVATRIRDWRGRITNDVKSRFCPWWGSKTTGGTIAPPWPSHTAPERHVPSVPDNWDPVEAGPHISVSGRLRGLSQGSPENERRGPREQGPDSDRTASSLGSKKRTANTRPRHWDGRSGF